MIRLRNVALVPLLTGLLTVASPAHATSEVNFTCGSLGTWTPGVFSGYLYLTVAENDRFTVVNNSQTELVARAPGGAETPIPAASNQIFDISAADAGEWRIDRPGGDDQSVTCVVGGALPPPSSAGDARDQQIVGATVLSQQTIGGIVDSVQKSIAQRFFGGGSTSGGVSGNAVSGYVSTGVRRQSAVLSELDTLAGADADSAWNIWTSARGTLFNGTGTVTVTGLTGHLAVGADVVLGDGFVVGALAAAESGSFTFPSTAGSLTGVGLSGGAYAGALLAPNLVLEGSLTNTWLAYTNTVGAATGSFNAYRLAATAMLTGSVDVTDTIVAEPTLRGTYIFERQAGYTMSDASVVAPLDINSGRLSLGSNFYFALSDEGNADASRFVLTVMGDYDVASVLPVSNLMPAFGGVLSGRVGAGFDTTFEGGASVGVTGEVGGLGGGQIHTYGVKVELTSPID